MLQAVELRGRENVILFLLGSVGIKFVSNGTLKSFFNKLVKIILVI